MKAAKKRWRPSPLLVVFTTALSVIALVVFSNLLSARRHRVNASVEIADPLVETATNQPVSASAILALPDGEIERTAARVREVSALLTGLTLFAVNEAIAKRPAMSVQALVNRFVARGLLPPGINRHTADGVLESDRAVIYVRYRPEPLAIEVVSMGREPLDGPGVIGRITTGVDESSGAALLIARQINGVSLPEPFAPIEQAAAMNWSVEPLRDRTFSPQELEQINNWLQTRSNGK
jgi:hypothetical protein